MTKADIIALVTAFSRNVLAVDVLDEETPGNVLIKVTLQQMSPDAEYDLRIGILQLLEEFRPAGVGFVVETAAPMTYVSSTFNLEMPGVPPGTPRSRFDAISEEMTVDIAPIKKSGKPEPDYVPRLFEPTIMVKERQLSACPKCQCFAFTPNAEKTHVMCRGCPLPWPTYALERMDGLDFTTSAYKCCGCATVTQVTMVMSELNLYCAICARLVIHTRLESKPTIRAANARLSEAIIKFKDIKADVETFKQAWPTPGWVNQTLSVPVSGKYEGKLTLTEESANSIRDFAKQLYENISRKPGETDGELRARIKLDLANADEISDAALKNAVDQLAANPVPNDWVQAIEIMQQRIAGAYGMSDQELTSSPAAGLFEMFRTKLGFQPFGLFESTKRNENIVAENKGWLPNDGSMRDRGTGRTTKGMLWAIAGYMTRDCNVFYVTALSEAYAKELARSAERIHAKLNLKRDMPVRPLSPLDYDRYYNYERERSYVFVDHTYYERQGVR